jgi:hypothetical protein
MIRPPSALSREEIEALLGGDGERPNRTRAPSDTGLFADANGLSVRRRGRAGVYRSDAGATGARSGAWAGRRRVRGRRAGRS